MKSEMKIAFVNGEEDLFKCKKAVQALRPHIGDNEYLEKCKLLLSEGAKMIFIDEGDVAPAFSVFRINYYFHRGKNLYIDDLGTLPDKRGKGYASALLNFLIEHAKENNCRGVDLDSGYGSNRWDAHRLYLSKGFHLDCHHFTLPLVP